jgi:hypothetical protein
VFGDVVLCGLRGGLSGGVMDGFDVV